VKDWEVFEWSIARHPIPRRLLIVPIEHGSYLAVDNRNLEAVWGRAPFDLGGTSYPGLILQEPDQVLFDFFVWLNNMPRFIRFRSLLTM
jgi:hypothetical protein